MKINILKSPEELGKIAAAFSAAILRKTIKNNGKARLILSTGASQFDTLKALVKEEVDWSKVEMFHLDEYIGIPENHPASFRRYLKERFIDIVNPAYVHLVNGEGDVRRNIALLSKEITQAPIDLGLIGIGENAHLAFNDPPADFEINVPYIIVTLNEACKKQQVREGWFPSIDKVPNQAISMSVHQIMQCRIIVSSVPYEVKAEAIKLTLENELTNKIPATILKTHPNANIFLDQESASMSDKKLLSRYI